VNTREKRWAKARESLLAETRTVTKKKKNSGGKNAKPAGKIKLNRIEETKRVKTLGCREKSNAHIRGGRKVPFNP